MVPLGGMSITGLGIRNLDFLLTPLPWTLRNLYSEGGRGGTKPGILGKEIRQHSGPLCFQMPFIWGLGLESSKTGVPQ